MNIKIRPLLITIGIGFVVQALIYVIADPFVGTTHWIGRWSSFFSLIVTVATGMIYPILASREKQLTMLSGVFGGVTAVTVTSILEVAFQISYLWLTAPSTIVERELRSHPFPFIAAFFVGTIGGLMIKGVFGAVGGMIGMYLVGEKGEEISS